jgi:uncharacterized membrane protein YkgB
LWVLSFGYGVQTLIPFISHGPLIFWMYPVFGIRGANWFLGVAEGLFGALLSAGFWNKKLGLRGDLGAMGAFIATVTILPFMPMAGLHLLMDLPPCKETSPS